MLTELKSIATTNGGIVLIIILSLILGLLTGLILGWIFGFLIGRTTEKK